MVEKSKQLLIYFGDNSDKHDLFDQINKNIVNFFMNKSKRLIVLLSLN